MSRFNFNNKTFRGVENYDSGDMNQETLFHYQQRDNIVWATFEGGGVGFGSLVAKVREDQSLDMVWQYLSADGRFVTGTCHSVPEETADGRIRLVEDWTINDTGERGHSVVEEQTNTAR